MLKLLILTNTIISLPISPVIDIVPPSITGPTDIEISYISGLSEGDILDYFTITDNVTSQDELNCVFNKHLTLDKPNENLITLSVFDKANNKGSFFFHLKVFDDVAPIIYGPDSITYLQTNAPSEKDLLLQYESIDEIDYICETILQNNNYDEISTIPGKYKLILESTDKSNNKATRNIILNIKNTQPETWHTSSAVLTVSPKEYLTPLMCLETLIEKGWLENKNYLSATYIEGDYSLYYDQEGVYTSILFIEESSSSLPNIEIEITFIVKNESIEENSTSSFIDSIINFFQTLWQSIVDFFKKFFSF